jgi:hypothetical protein
VYGYASPSGGETYGVAGQSNSTGGAGVYARGLDAGADLILAGNADTTSGDDGKIYSDRDYTSSDIYLIANDNVRIDLNEDNAGDSDSDFEIFNGDNALIFGVDESGAVTFGGTGIAAFPRPAYDSGWLTLGQGGEADRTHNIYGNVDNYVVDLTCKTPALTGINNWGVGGDANWEESYGAWWSRLTTTGIRLHRWNDDTDCPQVRVRIWVYP